MLFTNNNTNILYSLIKLSKKKKEKKEDISALSENIMVHF